MKKLFICIIMVLCLGVNNSISQTIERNGKVFISKSTRAKADTLVTDYKFEANGVQHPIIINKSTGSCYIWIKSRNNKLYKKYMKPEVSEQIARELGIEYKPRNRR